ncbi:MAG: DUF2177 family protein [Casimicrobiaceae bacterium]
MPKFIAAFAAAVIVLCVGDFAWLGLIAKSFVKREIGALMYETPRWLPIALFYPMYAVALWVFAISPALDAGPWRSALLGALFGLFCYATYDLTNLATLKGWSVSFALVDVAWGTLLSAAAAAAGNWAARHVG